MDSCGAVHTADRQGSAQGLGIITAAGSCLGDAAGEGGGLGQSRSRADRACPPVSSLRMRCGGVMRCCCCRLKALRVSGTSRHENERSCAAGGVGRRVVIQRARNDSRAQRTCSVADGCCDYSRHASLGGRQCVERLSLGGGQQQLALRDCGASCSVSQKSKSSGAAGASHLM